MEGSSATIAFPLAGPAGEPVDLWRTFMSHGVATLPPMRVDEEARTFRATISVDGVGARTVRVEAGEPGYGRIEIVGPPVGSEAESRVLAVVRHLLQLDADLSGFYALAATDPALAWVTRGAGRMIRSETVFEDVVKTILTTNCAWSATERMVRALVEHLGARAPGAPETGHAERAFPTPQAMAEAGEDFYRDVVRAGYRGRYLASLAQSVAAGEVDLEVLGAAPAKDLPDDEVEKRLLALPGVGPYAAAHVSMMLGRCSRLILDSWTRPTYARLIGRESVPDAEIIDRFQPYGRYAGLAFWLFLTREWVTEAATETGVAGPAEP